MGIAIGLGNSIANEFRSLMRLPGVVPALLILTQRNCCVQSALESKSMATVNEKQYERAREL